jgi:GT2 family glycosyltransferase
MKIGLCVPVLSNFEGFTRLMHSVDTEITPFVIENYDGNRGVSWAWNEGMRRAANAGIDYLLISNDDVVFERSAIDTLASRMLQADADLMTMVNTRDFPEWGTGSVHEVDFACFMVDPRRFPEEFGWFDENFYPAYFEDNDMYYRIELGGGFQRKVLDARMFHAGSVTQNYGGNQVVTSPMFESNRNYFIAKWGGAPGQEVFREPFNGAGGKTFKDW